MGQKEEMERADHNRDARDMKLLCVTGQKTTYRGLACGGWGTSAMCEPAIPA
jgi:hypothetical protein